MLYDIEAYPNSGKGLLYTLIQANQAYTHAICYIV